jgi:peptide/nickel transport system substrate-binding protein
VLRNKVIRNLDAQIVALQTCQADILSGLIRKADIEKLNGEGFTITSTYGFHIFFIGFNVRPGHSPPLDDQAFRHALAHSLDKTGILGTHGYLKAPVHSMVPPSLGEWHNPAVDPHPYNPGDPFTSPPGEHSTCGILKEAGYTFEDADLSGTVTSPDYWTMPDGDYPLPDICILTPLLEVAPQTYSLIHAWIEDAKQIGLASTAENGESGLIQVPVDDYFTQVFIVQEFDGFVLAWLLDRFPTYLYGWFHSSQAFPGGGNAYGLHDPELDILLEIMKFGTNHAERVEACHHAQERLAELLPTIPFYTRMYYDAFKPGLRGIVNSPGYGAENMWTYLNLYWEPVTPQEQVATEILPDDPNIFNPFSGNVYAWKFMDHTFDALMAISPYNHRDLPWIATEWVLTETPTGMDATYYLRDDVYWQDGYPYTASDAEFSLEFIRDWQLPGLTPVWQNIIDVEVINDFTFTVHANATSEFLIYDWAVWAARLPPQVWDRPWSSLTEILEYNLSGSYDPAPGYDPGPTPPPTNLFGTGPFIFDFYDFIMEYGEMLANRAYFLTQDEVLALKIELFWEIGDYNRDGIINVIDLTGVSLHFGAMLGDPEYDPDADFNSDGIIDMRDVATLARHLLWQREYP